MFRAQNRYKVCSGYEAIEYINKCLKQGYAEKLSKDQERVLREQFGNNGMLGNLGMDVQFYVWQEEKPQGNNMLWRLTIPFYFIFSIFSCFIYEPIYWLFTGKWSLGRDSKYLQFTYWWSDKIFKRRY